MKFFALIALIGLSQSIQLNQMETPPAPAVADKAGADGAANEEKSSGADRPDPADSEENAVKSPEEKAEAADKANGTEEKAPAAAAAAAKAGKGKAKVADPSADAAAANEPEAGDAAKNTPPRKLNESEIDRRRMIRVATVAQEAIQSNNSNLDKIKEKYDSKKAIPDDSKDASVDKESSSRAGYEEGMADAKAGTAKESKAKSLNSSTPSEAWVSNMNVDGKLKEPVVQQTVATNS